MSKQQNTSLTEKTGVVVFSRILGTFVEIATIVFLVRMLTDTDFAIVSMLLLVYETAKYFATLGFPDSVFYFFERIAKDARRSFALQTCVIMLVTGFISVIFILIFNAILPIYLSEWTVSSIETAQELMPVMALIALLEIPTWPVNNLMLAADRQKDAGVYQILNGTMTFLAMILPLVLGYDFTVAIWSLLGYSVIRFIMSLIWMLHILPPSTEKLPRGLIKEQSWFAIPIGLSSLVSRLNRYADKFIVSYFISEEAFAIYMVGAQEIPAIRVIPFAVGSVLISRFVAFNLAKDRNALIDLWRKGVEKVALIVVPISILFIVIAYEFIVLLFGITYAPAVILFQIYTVIILIRVAHYGSILQAFGDTKKIVMLSLNLLISNVILTIPLTFYFGLIGAVIGTLIANLYNWVVTLKVIGGHLEVPWFKVIPFGNYFKIVGLSLVSGIMVMTLSSLLLVESIVINLAWKSIIYLISFAFMGHFTGVISPKDRRDFLNWIQLKFLYK
jgi:O-antigen/teichoic acid export membrane protein